MQTLYGLSNRKLKIGKKTKSSISFSSENIAAAPRKSLKSGVLGEQNLNVQNKFKNSIKNIAKCNQSIQSSQQTQYVSALMPQIESSQQEYFTHESIINDQVQSNLEVSDKIPSENPNASLQILKKIRENQSQIDFMNYQNQLLQLQMDSGEECSIEIFAEEIFKSPPAQRSLIQTTHNTTHVPQIYQKLNQDQESPRTKECSFQFHQLQDKILKKIQDKMIKSPEMSQQIEKNVISPILESQQCPSERSYSTQKSQERRKRSERIKRPSTASEVQSSRQLIESSNKKKLSSRNSSKQRLNSQPKQQTVSSPKVSAIKQLKLQSPVTKQNESTSIATMRAYQSPKLTKINTIKTKEIQAQTDSPLKQQLSECYEQRPLQMVTNIILYEETSSIISEGNEILNKLKQKIAARRIQRIFKKFLNHKKYLFIQKVTRSIIKIENSFRAFLTRKKILKGLNWRKNIKERLMAVIVAWRTRKTLNCLTAEVQQFVNCENICNKNRLRQEFNLIYEKILREKLYITKYARVLQRLQQIHKSTSESLLVSLQSQSLSSLASLTKAHFSNVLTPKTKEDITSKKSSIHAMPYDNISQKKKRHNFSTDSSSLQPTPYQNIHKPTLEQPYPAHSQQNSLCVDITLVTGQIKTMQKISDNSMQIQNGIALLSPVKSQYEMNQSNQKERIQLSSSKGYNQSIKQIKPRVDCWNKSPIQYRDYEINKKDDKRNMTPTIGRSITPKHIIQNQNFESRKRIMSDETRQRSTSASAVKKEKYKLSLSDLTPIQTQLVNQLTKNLMQMQSLVIDTNTKTQLAPKDQRLRNQLVAATGSKFKYLKRQLDILYKQMQKDCL